MNWCTKFCHTLNVEQRFRTSVFYKVVWQHRSGEVENECTSVIISVAKIAEAITKSTVAQLEVDARK